MNEHYGRNVDKMPELLESGEVPASVARIMQARLKQGNESPDLWKNWYDTSDLVIYPKENDKDIYVLLAVNNKGQITKNGRNALELIRKDNLASNRGAIVEQLKELRGEGLIKVPRKKIKTETYLTKKQILGQQIWRILARHPDEVPSKFSEDKNLLRAYSGEVEGRTGNSENMALYIGDSLKDKTILKAWCVDWLVGRSNADGWNDLDSDYGRLVGLAPEALGEPGKGAKDLVQRVLPIETFSVRQVIKEAGCTGDYASNQVDKLQNILEQEGYQITRRK